jgi:sugar phosphate isomerase/epimerase
MLNRLGIKSVAWDWREEHVPTLEDEINALNSHGIELKSVWFWIEGTDDKIMNTSLEQILETLSRTNTKTELWVSFPASYFENLSEELRIKKGIATIEYLQDRVKEIGCKIALYNHGDWFGEPENQIKIIDGLKDNHVGLVYNFHHAHEQLDRYDELVDVMKPYLWTVNLNGMKHEGPKIIDIGKGDEEIHMMEKLKAIGFQGSIGILGHTEGEDIEVVLQRNIDGLKQVLKKMDQQEALKTY